MENVRLCFGTLASVLNIFRKSNITQVNFISDLIVLFDPQSPYVGDGSSITKLLKYQINFVLSEEASKPSRGTLKEYISDQIDPKIKIDGKKVIILALLDIIRKDMSLDQKNKELFKYYFGMYKYELLLESEFEFSDFVSSALLYATDEDVKNRDTVSVINDEYINAVTSPYLDDIDWDEEYKTLTLTYVNLYKTFCRDLKKNEIDIFLSDIDPNLEINGDIISKCDDFFYNVSHSEKYRYRIDKNRKSFIWDKIELFIHKFDNYVNYICINCTPNISAKNFPYDGPPEGECDPVYHDKLNDRHEVRYIGQKEIALPNPANTHKFFSDTKHMFNELNDIFNTMSLYVFPHCPIEKKNIKSVLEYLNKLSESVFN